MSDEASGPENEDNLQEWTTQMAIASHKDVTNMTAVQLYQDPLISCSASEQSGYATLGVRTQDLQLLLHMTLLLMKTGMTKTRIN